MLESFNRYRPVWINVDDLEKEANFLEIFVKAEDYEIFVNCDYWQKLKIEPDELLDIFDNIELILKLLKNTLSTIVIDIYLEKTLSVEEQEKIYNLRTEVINIEVFDNEIIIRLKFWFRKLTKEEILDFFNKLYEILYQ